MAGGRQFLLFILPCFLLFFLFFFVLVSAFLPPSLSVFSSFISTLSPLFFLSVYPLSCAPSFCSPRLPCIYRQKQGRDMDGAIIVQPPHDCPRRHVSFVSPTRGRPRVSLVSGCPWSTSFWCFSEEEKSVKTGEQKLSSLVFCTSKGRRRHTVSFKTAPFWVLFYEQWMKWRHFGQNAPFHLKEKGGKNVSKSKSVFNLWFVHLSPQL